MQTTGTALSARERGFTLIELLIVVVVIGLLAAIAIPKFSGVKEKAYDRAVMSDLRNAMVAIESYLAENDVYPLSPEDAGFAPSSGVTFTTWSASGSSVHMHAEHAGSSHYYHARYPTDSELEQRNK